MTNKKCSHNIRPITNGNKTCLWVIDICNVFNLLKPLETKIHCLLVEIIIPRPMLGTIIDRKIIIF